MTKPPQSASTASSTSYGQRQARKVRKCQPNECYCVKCRAPRVPAGLTVEYLPMTPTSGNLRAICPACSTLMHRRTGLANPAALWLVFEVSAPDGTLCVPDDRGGGSATSGWLPVPRATTVVVGSCLAARVVIASGPALH